MATEEIPVVRSLVAFDEQSRVDALLKQGAVIDKYSKLLKPDPQRIIKDPELNGKVIVETTQDGKEIYIVSSGGLIRLPHTLYWITGSRHNIYLTAAARCVKVDIASGYRQGKLLGVLPYQVVYLDGIRRVDLEATLVQFGYPQVNNVLSKSSTPISVQVIDPDCYQQCQQIAAEECKKEAMEEYRSFFQPASDMAVVDHFETTLASQFEPPENIFKFDLIHHRLYEDRWITAHLVRVPEEESEAAKAFDSQKMPGRPVIHLTCPQRLRQDFFGREVEHDVGRSRKAKTRYDDRDKLRQAQIERRNIDRLRRAIYTRYKIPSDLYLDIKFID